MIDHLQSVRNALRTDLLDATKPRWLDILSELNAATTNELSPAVERLLLEILRFDGQLSLDENSDMPHRMAPEPMLKLYAIKVLAERTGSFFLPTMRRILATARPASFAGGVRAVIQKLLAKKHTPETAEAVVQKKGQLVVRTLADIPANATGVVSRSRPKLKQGSFRAFAVRPAFGMTLDSRISLHANADGFDYRLDCDQRLAVM